MPGRRNTLHSLSTLAIDSIVEGTDYKVIRRLDEGGMGVVYEVEHLRTGERRALKILKRSLADRPDYEERLLREARALERLRDVPYVVQVFESGRLPSGRPYYVMALVEGETLRDRLKRGPLAPSEALGLLGQILRALKAVHEAGIVHRDIKPENIVITPDGDAVLIDFGLVKELEAGALGEKTFPTAPHQVVGTGPYLPPELAYGLAPDALGDLYAVGVVLYECLVGSLPHAAVPDSGYHAYVARHGFPTLAQAGVDVSPALERVVCRAVASNPVARYQTADEFSLALLGACAPTLLTRRPTPTAIARAVVRSVVAALPPAVRVGVAGLVLGVVATFLALILRAWLPGYRASAESSQETGTEPRPVAPASSGGGG